MIFDIGIYWKGQFTSRISVCTSVYAMPSTFHVPRRPVSDLFQRAEVNRSQWCGVDAWVLVQLSE